MEIWIASGYVDKALERTVPTPGPCLNISLLSLLLSYLWPGDTVL